MTSKIHTIQLPYCRICIHGKEFVEIDIHPDTDITAREVEEMITQARILSGNQSMLVLMIIGERGTFSKDAREFSADPEKENFSLGTAYVITGLAEKIIANFFFKINRPPKPVKMFNSKPDAVQWLSQLSKTLGEKNTHS